MTKVWLELYDFLMERECHVNKIGTSIDAFVLVSFYDLQDFVKIAGRGFFDDGGLEINLGYDYVAVSLIDLLEYYDEEIENYKNCFDEFEWIQIFGV